MLHRFFMLTERLKKRERYPVCIHAGSAQGRHRRGSPLVLLAWRTQRTTKFEGVRFRADCQQVNLKIRRRTASGPNHSVPLVDVRERVVEAVASPATHTHTQHDNLLSVERRK